MEPTSTKTAHKPTAEQAAIIAAVLNGKDVVVTAGAGTGKTSTVEHVAAAVLNAYTRPKILYLCFGKANQLEAQDRMPEGVACKTFHGLAWASHGARFAKKLRDAARMRSDQKAALLGITDLHVDVKVAGEPVRRSYRRAFLAELVMDACANFAKSHARAISVAFLPSVKCNDPEMTDAVNQAVASHLDDTIRRAWVDLTSPAGALPMSHDVYLKLLQLELATASTATAAQYDLVIVDEAQDSSACRLSIARRLAKQLVVVGDENQMIFEWAGAVNVMDPKYIPGAVRLSLTKSFRFGPAVATAANKVLALLPTDLRLVGHDPINTQIKVLDRPDAVLCRTNGGVMAEIARAITENRTVSVVGGIAELQTFLRAARDLMTLGRTDHRDLRAFNAWADVVAAVDDDQAFADLATFVRLIEQLGVERLLADLATVGDNGDLKLCTAHKSKGLEFDTVRLGGDFGGRPVQKMTAEETRLLYVAVTRARLALDPFNSPLFV